MQKYRLVYETESEQIDIYLKGIDNQYTNNLELCFIDAFTSVYSNQQECVKYLQEKQIINPSNGTLKIKRVNGKEIATEIYYKNEDMRIISLEVCQKLRNGTKSTLSETKEYKKMSSDIIKFFYSNEEAINSFNKSFYANKLKLFVETLNLYIQYKEHDSFYEPGEITRREKLRKELYNFLKKYETLREVHLWIKNYQNNSKKVSNSIWKNPYEEYERKQGEYELKRASI